MRPQRRTGHASADFPAAGYLTTIRSVQPPTRWKILVVDSFTRTHLNALLKLDAILREQRNELDRADDPVEDA